MKLSLAIRLPGGLVLTLALALLFSCAGDQPSADGESLDSLVQPDVETATSEVDDGTRVGELPAVLGAQLRSMAYTAGTFDPNAEKKGVLIHDEERAHQGLNFFTSRDLAAAFLMDMDGRMVHRWRRGGGNWQHAEVRPNGDVIYIVKETQLVKVDRESNVLWNQKIRAHHDHFTAYDGNIYVLTNRLESIPALHPVHKILADYVTVVSDDGEILEEYPLIPMLRRSAIAGLLPQAQHLDLTAEGERPEDVELDYLHANHIEIFDGSVPGALYRPGLALVSLRQINTVAILDLEQGEVLWFWGPSNLVRQHHPTLLPNGNILVFNNRDQRRRSAVIEIDPRTYDVVWRYSVEGFFTALRGSNQRLPNGNTLITESDTGYAMEVTAEGETVWEFANLQIDEKQIRSAIWRMWRVDPSSLPFLAEMESAR